MKVILILLIVFFTACTKSTWTDEQKKALMLQQAQVVSSYISNYNGQKLNDSKSEELIEVTACLGDLYTDKYNSYKDYFEQLPKYNSKNQIDINKKKALMKDLLTCNIKVSGMGYILMAQDGIEGYNIENMPEVLKKQLRYDVKHR